MDDNKKFVPFQKVLVRDNDLDVWRVNFFSHYVNEYEGKYQCVSCIWKDCIPYEGNESLVGTNKDISNDVGEIVFMQKVIAWNEGLEKVKGYFFEKMTHKNGEIGYKVINPKRECIDYFYYCVPDEWEK